MNVEQLISELSKLPPHAVVRGFNTVVMLPNVPFGGLEIRVPDEYAQEVTAVTWRGFDVVLECDGMCAG